MIRKVVFCVLVFFYGVHFFSTANELPIQKSREQRWVDSVYQTLSLKDQIAQIIFSKSPPKDNITLLGGLIMMGGSKEEIPSTNRLSPLLGWVPGNNWLIDQSVDSEQLLSTNDKDFLRDFFKRDFLISEISDFDFAMFPSGSLPLFSDDAGINDKMLGAYLRGLHDAGLEIWSDNQAILSVADAMSTTNLVVRNNLSLSDLSKKDVKRLGKKKREGLVYYETQITDPNRLNAILISDVIVVDGSVSYYVDEIEGWLTRKKIKKKVFEAKVKKILSKKFQRGYDDSIEVPSEDQFVIDRTIMEKGMVLLKNEGDVVPIKRLDGRYFASLSLGVFENESFQKSLDHYTLFSHFGEADFLQSEKELLNSLIHYDYVVTGFSFPEVASSSNPDFQKRVAFLKKVAEKTNLIVVVLAGSRWAPHFDFSHSLLLTYSSQAESQSIASQILFGALNASGQLPLSLNVDFPAGSGIISKKLDRLGYSKPEYEGFKPYMEKKIDYIVRSAIDSMATPGCQVLIARKGKVVLEKAYGHYTYDSLQPVATNTIYDIASVTKVVGTLQATMFLSGRQAFNLDSTASHYLPELTASNKKKLVIRDILTHQAGLQSYFPFYRKTFRGDRLSPNYYQSSQQKVYNQSIAPGIYGHQSLDDSVWSWTIKSRLRKKPKWKKKYEYRYSDLGFLIMYKLNERLINQPMDQFLTQNFYEPLGMSSTGYQPLCRFPLHQIAPTEHDDDYRNALIWGTVHDENAALTGGVSGHAGLFSTANDLAILLQMNLQDGRYGGIKYFEKGTIGEFSRKQFPGNRRGLGWDKPRISGEFRNPSNFSSKQTFGHLGFTGTAVWVDPEYELIYIFLSNRVHPHRENNKLMVDNIRSRIHDVVYESIPGFKKDS